MSVSLFFFSIFSLLQSTIPYLPYFELLLRKRCSYGKFPILGHWLGLCLGLELRCQYRLHIRHGNMDRRRNLPNYIYPCRCSTLSRLGRFRMGRSIRFVLLYVSFSLFYFFPPALCFQRLSHIIVMRHGRMKEGYDQAMMRLMISMGSWRFNVPNLLLLDHVSVDE